MATKREHETLEESEAGESTLTSQPNKRQRKNEEYKKRKQNSGVDPTYGQRNAFSVENLTTPSDDDLEFEDQTDALAYLRAVQQETKQIPHVVVAPKAGPQLPPELETDRSIYETGVGDARGYYHDGAYTAAPELVSSQADQEADDWQDNDSDNNDDDPVKRHATLVESYCTSLLTRYTALRDLLQSDPPQSAIDALPADHETHVDKFGPKSGVFRKWEHRLRYTDPLPAQIASMDKISVLRLLRVILGGVGFLRRGAALRERTSRWIWALLARLPDRGELDSVEIGWVRDLGKRAVAVSISREHARALSEVVDRAQLKGFGLGGVLNEIDEEDDEGEEEEEGYAELEVEMDVVAGSEEVLSGSKDTGLNSMSPVPQKEEDATSQNGEDVPMDLEDGEVDEDDDQNPTVTQEQDADVPEQVEVHREANSDMEDGEISDGEPAQKADEDAIAAVKARLLASLESAETWEEPPPSSQSLPKRKDPLAEQFNMRTTVNMILTVAGEFYGQRDLLQFRAPFAEF